MTVYSYTRVSTGRQANEGESLDAQQARLTGYAMMNGETIAQTFVERGVSGTVKFTERSEGARLWSSLHRGDKVICCKLDRMFRSSLDALDMHKRFQDLGIELHFLDMGGNVCGNGLAKLFFTILSAVAEAERERTRERVIEVKTHQRSQGRFLGGTVPFGHRIGEDGHLVEDTEQQASIGVMRELRASGLSFRAISSAMEQRGVKISFKAVSDVLART